MSIDMVEKNALQHKADTFDFWFDPIIFQVPEYLTQEIYWHGHIPFAFWLIAKLQPRTFVELGAYRGDSYFAFCQAVKMVGLKTKCFAVDNWAGDVHYGQYDEDIFQKVWLYHESKYAHFSRLIRSNFDDALDSFADASIDLLHIDGTHTYDAARHDFETWLPKMSDRGVILFHDIATVKEQYGVWKLWSELKVKYPHITFTHSSGLGVLIVGEDAPFSIVQLAELKEERNLGFVSALERLGEVITLNSHINNQRKWFEHEMEKYEILRKEDHIKFDELIHALGDKDNEINKLNANISDITIKMEAYHQENDRLNRELQNIYHSKSWRMLRFFKKLYKKVRG